MPQFVKSEQPARRQAFTILWRATCAGEVVIPCTYGGNFGCDVVRHFVLVVLTRCAEDMTLGEKKVWHAGEAGPQGPWGRAAPYSAPAWVLRGVDGNRPWLGLRRLGQRQRQDAVPQIGANAFLVDPLAQLKLPEETHQRVFAVALITRHLILALAAQGQDVVVHPDLEVAGSMPGKSAMTTRLSGVS